MAIPVAIRRAVQTRRYKVARPQLHSYISGRLQEKHYRAALPALLLLDLIQWEQEPSGQPEPPSYLKLALAVAEKESRWLGVVLLAHYLAWLKRRTRVIAALQVDGVVAKAYDEQWHCPSEFATLWKPVIAAAKPRDPRPLLLARELAQGYAETQHPALQAEALLAGCAYLFREGQTSEALQWLAEVEALLEQAQERMKEAEGEAGRERYRTLHATLMDLQAKERRGRTMPIPKAIRRAVQTRQDERAVAGLQRYVAHCLKRGKPRPAIPALLLLDLIQWEREPADQPGPPVYLEQALALAEQEGRWLGLLMMGFYLNWLGRYNRMGVVLLLDMLAAWALRQTMPAPPAVMPFYILASRGTKQHDPRIRLLMRTLEQAHAEGGRLGDRFYALMFGCYQTLADGLFDEGRSVLKQLEALHAATPPTTQFWPPSQISRTQLYPREGARSTSKQTPWENVEEGIRMMYHLLELAEQGKWPPPEMR